jgi:hemoglobin
MTADGATAPLYDTVGGMRFFEELVDRFYAGVASDPVLLALYPEPHDLSGARRRLTLFLAQYWGGPTTYSNERGHPALRMRHLPFTIGPEERDRWLHHMLSAVEASTDDQEVRDALTDYFVRAAEHMRNDSPMRFVPGS